MICAHPASRCSALGGLFCSRPLRLHTHGPGASLYVNRFHRCCQEGPVSHLCRCDTENGRCTHGKVPWRRTTAKPNCCSDLDFPSPKDTWVTAPKKESGISSDLASETDRRQTPNGGEQRPTLPASFWTLPGITRPRSCRNCFLTAPSSKSPLVSLLTRLLFPPLGVPDGETGAQPAGWSLLPGLLPTGTLRGRLP